jgi:acetyl-CoA carboxylase, biotin carboxylase subunit
VHKVLIANRGEVAVRVIRACRELALQCVAVYSEADRDALHTRLADEAVEVGGTHPHDSYLNIGRLLDAAQASGADAVHPGYGFLAESAEFAAAARDAGLTFVGPPAAVIARVGDKIAARRLMEQSGIPVVPGFAEQGATDQALAAAAGRIGGPLLIKAAGGGGGRGMRFIEAPSQILAALASARREARAAFGSDDLFLERRLEDVRHIEMQIAADGRGEICHLGERECSVQRRHQKLIEEAPSPFVDPPLRRRLGETAIAAASAAGYINIGSVEFLVEPSGRFFFLEINPRLQVEHGITELTMGVDLVKLQLRIAAGEALPPMPDQARGHAIECRIYAEDPAHGFAPSPGQVLALDEPAGPGIRVDSGLRVGWRVPAAYDPLLAKVMTWDYTRGDAIARMAEALRSYVILGCRTNLGYVQDVIRHEAFRLGETTTRFLERHFAAWQPRIEEFLLAAGAAVVLGDPRPFEALPDRLETAWTGEEPAGRTGWDPWSRLGPWRMGGDRA